MAEITPGLLDALWAYAPDKESPLMKLRKDYFAAVPEICTERSLKITENHLANGLLGEDPISILDKARVYRKVLEERTPVVWHETGHKKKNSGPEMEEFPIHDSSPFAGSTTSKFKGVVIHPELLGLMLWPELGTMTDRKENPFYITEQDAEDLNLKVFNHWVDKNIFERARKEFYPNQFIDDGTSGQGLDEMKLLQYIVFFLTSKVLCISHTIPDFSRAVNEGLRAVIEDATSRRNQAGEEPEIAFYSAVIEVLEGIIAYAKALAKKAESMASEPAYAARRTELNQIAAIYKKVPEQPAETFREGLTAVWVCWTAILLENPNIGMSLGRLDQLLYPLYKKDMERPEGGEGLSPKKAVDLVCYFLLKLGDHVPIMTETAEQMFGGTGANQALTIGGVDEKGEDAVNDVTYVFLRAVELMKLRDPNLNARYHPEKNPDEYLNKLCGTNIKTHATPAIHNDRAIIKALMGKGHSIEQARDYGIVGCVEPTSSGRHYAHCAAVLINLPAALEMTLNNGWHPRTGTDPAKDPRVGPQTGPVEELDTFDKFKDAFARQTQFLADKAVHLNNQLGLIHQKFYPTPIISSFFQGPMDKGKDVIEGGALVNSSGVAIIGFADVADSLNAIERWVYKEDEDSDKRISLTELHQALKENFQGGPDMKALHTRLLNAPKYGTDNPAADANAKWLVELLDSTFHAHPNYRGGEYRVGYWTMTIHAAFGLLTGALPNGRKARENFASGITPVSGATPCLILALNSAADLPATALSSGVALNLKYTPETGDPNMLSNFVATVKAVFDDNDGTRDGAVEVQFNVTSHGDYAKAVKDPANYRELLVRVSGYTAYFIDLNPRMQKEIIDRTEYMLSSGKMIPYEPFPLKED